MWKTLLTCVVTGWQMLKLTNKKYANLIVKEFIFAHKIIQLPSKICNVHTLQCHVKLAKLEKHYSNSKILQPWFFYLGNDNWLLLKGKTAIEEFPKRTSWSMVPNDNNLLEPLTLMRWIQFGRCTFRSNTIQMRPLATRHSCKYMPTIIYNYQICCMFMVVYFWDLPPPIDIKLGDGLYLCIISKESQHQGL